MSCNRCWTDTSVEIQEAGAFRLVRDPGHWGSADPTTLVLGISKGNTQTSAFATDQFDAIAFKGIRHRLLQVLQAVGLLFGETPTAFERRFCAGEREYAFASVLRCSMTGLDRKKGIHTSDSPNVAPAFKTGSAGYRFAYACVDQHIGKLPSATKRVLLLGTTDGYVDNLREMIARTAEASTRSTLWRSRRGACCLSMSAIRRRETDTLALIFAAKGNPERKGAWLRQRLRLLDNAFHARSLKRLQLPPFLVVRGLRPGGGRDEERQEG